MEDANGKFFRVVDVVLVRIQGPAGRLLIETHHQMQDGRKSATNRLPGTKKRPHESIKATARRLLMSYLRLPEGAVGFREGGNELIEEELESPAYPGVRTVYRKYISEAYFSTADTDVLETYGLPKCTEFTMLSTMADTRTWAWWSARVCEEKGVIITGSTKKSRFEGMKLADPSLENWTADEIRSKLEKHGLDVSLYGVDKARSLEQIANEVQRGECYLMEGEGKILRVVDLVLVRLAEPGGRVLVEVKHVHPDGTELKTERFPATKRRPGDNVWRTARRMIEQRVQLKDTPSEHIHIRLGVEELTEEESTSPSYPGLLSVYRKHYVDAFMGQNIDSEDMHDMMQRAQSSDRMSDQGEVEVTTAADTAEATPPDHPPLPHAMPPPS
jgi:hypothetical protein